MKTLGILTFHFAYNYGAMLQAYALKTYLAQKYNVEIINYQPQKTRKIYSTNPFEYGMHPKAIMQRIKDWPCMKKQANVFERFKKEYLEVDNNPFYDLETLRNKLINYDVNLFGSDQIWNLNITGETAEYYGVLCDSDRHNVVYAGSFGHDTLTEKENEFVKRMNSFDRVSVRELYAKEILEKNGISALHVCDPVFLIGENIWESVAKRPKVIHDERFILFYSLKEDRELCSYANYMANKLGMKIISIHPNASKITVGKQLYGIGPQEFLWLIKNASYICTNSFHASSFSMIFSKKLVYSQFEDGKSRVQSLLDTISIQKSVDSNGIECVDFLNIDKQKLNDYINKSKEFLEEIK